jgi:hypothetical protein
MYKNYIPFLCFCFLLGKLNPAQAQVAIVGFYNCENYYDTINQVKVIDEEYLPNSDKHYSQSVFQLKSKRLASVLYALGKANQADGLALMGLVEIENKMVLTREKSPLISFSQVVPALGKRPWLASSQKFCSA